MSNAINELKWRGLLYDHTEGLPKVLAKNKLVLYNGFDPTSDSLQVGNLVPLMGIARLQRFGHSPIAVAGGGTGLIGDPSGKSEERQLMSIKQVEANVEKIKPQLERLLDFETKSNPARVVNNADWLTSVSMMEFMREVGKHFSVNYMTAKDSVKSRLDRDEGISYTEFSYMLLQAYDYLVLHDRYNCRLQSGGSDQWGNITAGVELIRRKRAKKVHGLVFPLVTDDDGSKMGKTARGAVYLDAKRTSPYQFYQFWFNQPDSKVIDFLRIFTWLSRSEIEELSEVLAERPEHRDAQRALAVAMTRMIHDETGLERAQVASQALFGGSIDGLSALEIADIFSDVPSGELPADRLSGEGLPADVLLSEMGIFRSKGEARRMIAGGGVYLNNLRVKESDQLVTLADAIEGQFLVLRRGKRRYHLVKVQR
jgi:tyrosyl-tRNA synthetase